MQPNRTRSVVIVALALAGIVAAGFALRYELHALQPDALYDQARAARRAGQPPHPRSPSAAPRVEMPHPTGNPAAAPPASHKTE